MNMHDKPVYKGIVEISVIAKHYAASISYTPMCGLIPCICAATAVLRLGIVNVAHV